MVRLVAMLLLSLSGAAAAQLINSPNDVDPLGSGAQKRGLTTSDLAKIRGAAGMIVCPGRNLNGWLINSGTQVLTALHGFIDDATSRVAANPANCHFAPATDPRQKLKFKTVSLLSKTKYLYLRSQPGRRPKLEQRPVKIEDTTELNLLQAKRFDLDFDNDWLVLDLARPALDAPNLKFDTAGIFYATPTMHLVSHVTGSVIHRIRGDRLTIQSCEGRSGVILARTLLVSCFAEPGMSGGILFRKEGDEMLAIAMLVAGDVGSAQYRGVYALWLGKPAELKLDTRNYFLPDN